MGAGAAAWKLLPHVRAATGSRGCRQLEGAFAGMRRQRVRNGSTEKRVRSGEARMRSQPDSGSVGNRYFWFSLPIVELRFGANGLTLGNSLGQFGSMRETVRVSLDWASAIAR